MLLSCGILTGNQRKFPVRALFPQSQNFKGWRREVIAIASDCFAYYESPQKSMVYTQDGSLTIQLWFKTVEYLRTFVDKVGDNHSYYRIPGPISWDISFEAAESPHVLPVMKMDYKNDQSLFLEHTPLQINATDISAADAGEA
jgi:spore cortex formation protein SpoVR/YcgB (stage V sporulation)